MTDINNEKLNTEIAEEQPAAPAGPEAEVTKGPAAEKPVKKKKKYRINVLRMAVFVICIGVACFSAVKLIGILREYKKGTDTYSDVEEAAFIPPRHDTSDDPDASESLVPDVDFDALKQISGNAVGWLYSPGTVINYPVAKTKDNSYYLDHLIDGTYNSNGCFFVDYRNSDGFADRNTIIYGHRMKNGAMLSSIAKYNKQEYYDEHPVMYLITPDGKYELRIFSAYITEATSAAYRRTFDSDAKFTEWINNAVKHSYVKTDVKVGPEDRVVTLSTCVKAEDTRRFIALGKLVKIED
ncbi:MAG: class B sortase [Clostridia bacterium]|nr:class B sortase [Clostridia bacterium]